MSSQFEVNPYTSGPIEVPKETLAGMEMLSLLRQIADCQREQLHVLKCALAAHDPGARWRAFLNRWRQDFPSLAGTCREVLPILERAYGTLLADIADRLRDDASELDNDFTMQEFLDRYGTRLAQLGTVLNLLGPVAEAGAAEGQP